MVHLSRRPEQSSSVILRRASRDTDPMHTLVYTSSKPRPHTFPNLPSFFRATSRSAPLLALVALLLFLLHVVWQTPPLQALRGTLCNLTYHPPVRNNEVVLDRFADSAASSFRRPEWRNLYTLVMVAGHAIFTGDTWDLRSLHNEKNWLLEPFQKGQVPTFLRHIQRGVELAANDSSALLLFSGGQTRHGAGPRSEGITYWQAASASHWYGHAAQGVANRTLAEEYARDSMENLLFSVCRFKQVVGRYPHIIKVVSFGFKKIRFVDFHRKALRFPIHRFQFYGVDPDGVDGMHGLTAAERANAMGPFAADPYGCKTRVLRSKKEVRNPYLRYHPYPQGCPELAPLFRYCDRRLYTGALPWDPRIHSKPLDRT